MTVEEFAISMYQNEIIKDRVIVLDESGDQIYDGRMEFLRFTEKEFPFIKQRIKIVTMLSTDGCWYTTVVTVFGNGD